MCVKLGNHVYTNLFIYLFIYLFIAEIIYSFEGILKGGD